MSKEELRTSNFDYDSSYDYYLWPENQVLIDCRMSYRKYNINLQVWGTRAILSFYIQDLKIDKRDNEYPFLFLSKSEF